MSTPPTVTIVVSTKHLLAILALVAIVAVGWLTYSNHAQNQAAFDKRQCEMYSDMIGVPSEDC